MALTSCPECGKSVSDRASACPHCGFEVGSLRRRDLRPIAKKRGCVSQVGSGCAVAVGIVMVLGCMGLLLAPRTGTHKERGPGSAPPVVPAKTEASSSLAIGDPVTLFLQGNTNVFLATSDDSWNDMLDAQNASSDAPLVRLIAQGKVAQVPNGSKATIIKTGFASMFVMTVDGIEGWIQREFVKAAK